VAGLRGAGWSSRRIYRHYMDTFFRVYGVCAQPDCRECESKVARSQRVILAALEVVASLEEGPDS
jgi:hypothetical protein